MRIAQVAPLAESVPPKLYGGSPNHLALAGFLFPCPWAGNPPTSLSEGHGPGLGIVLRRFSHYRRRFRHQVIERADW